MVVIIEFNMRMKYNSKALDHLLKKQNKMLMLTHILKNRTPLNAT